MIYLFLFIYLFILLPHTTQQFQSAHSQCPNSLTRQHNVTFRPVDQVMRSPGDLSPSIKHDGDKSWFIRIMFVLCREINTMRIRASRSRHV